MTFIILNYSTGLMANFRRKKTKSTVFYGNISDQEFIIDDSNVDDEDNDENDNTDKSEILYVECRHDNPRKIKIFYRYRPAIEILSILVKCGPITNHEFIDSQNDTAILKVELEDEEKARKAVSLIRNLIAK